MWAARCFQPLTQHHQVMAQVVHESAPLLGYPALLLLFRLSQQAVLMNRMLSCFGMIGHRSFGCKKIHGVHFVFPSVACAGGSGLAPGAKILNSTCNILTHDLIFVNTLIKIFGSKLQKFNIVCGILTQVRRQGSQRGCFCPCWGPRDRVRCLGKEKDLGRDKEGSDCSAEASAFGLPASMSPFHWRRRCAGS